jgi:ribosomal protein S12 methylthiotransferase accessory factor
VPESWDDFIDVFHGATFMGRPEQLPAFDFLRHSTRRRRLSEMPVLATGDARRDLAGLVGKLRAQGMEAFAVDLTTDEAVRAGMRVVRVIIPALQPLTFSYRARYLGHPRLYEAPRLMGYPVRAETEINHWPQPFA